LRILQKLANFLEPHNILGAKMSTPGFIRALLINEIQYFSKTTTLRYFEICFKFKTPTNKLFDFVITILYLSTFANLRATRLRFMHDEFITKSHFCIAYIVSVDKWNHKSESI
jgi:hypothetical protein